MRLRDISMLVTSLALTGIGVAAMISALKLEPPPPSNVSVSPVIQPPAAIPPLASAPPSRPQDDDIRVYSLGEDSNRDCRLAVLRRMPNPKQKSEMRWTLTFYELEEHGPHESRLHYLGSRCIEYDMGFDQVEFDSPKGYLPQDFRKYAEQAKGD
ncbi:MAG: hypothetical protein KDB90_00065 [Planctomycetes bacterium]|nr:hypothetical protein [Planctomycetota bacterium]